MRLLLILFLLSGGKCLAQKSTVKKDLLFTHFNVKDGLSSDETTCFYQDKKGFIWVGTTDGLNFCSANQTEVYRNVPKDTASLPDNIVNSLAEDDSGNLWVATIGGLSKMNLAKRKIEKIYKTDPVKPGSIRSTSILLFDRQGRLWNADFGIDLYDSSCDCFHHFLNYNYKNESSFNASNVITGLFQDSKDRIWASTRKGLYQFDPSTHQFIKLTGFFSIEHAVTKSELLDVTMAQVYEDHLNQLWVCTWDLGLIKFDPDQKKITKYPVKIPGTATNSKFNVTVRICETRDNQGQYHLWVAAGEGLADFAESKNQFNYYLHDPVDLRSPSAPGIRQLYADRSGILWILTEASGIDLLDPLRQIFKTHRFDPNLVSPAPSLGIVNSIYSDGDSTWLTSWFGNALYLLGKEFQILKKWERVPPASSSEENNRGNDVFKDREGFLWISTFHGLHRLDLKSNTFQSYYHNANDPTSLPNDRVVKYFEDSEGMSWVCFYKGGICNLNKKSGKFYDFRPGPKSKEEGAYYFGIWDIMEDHDHNVWFADDGIGLWKYDRKARTLDRMFTKKMDGHVATVYEDATHIIWATTRSGLCKIQNDSIRLLTSADGLPANNTLGARADNEDRLWVITNQGMTLYDKRKNIFKIFKEADGLEKTPADGPALQKLADGRMLIGGNNYITEFDPKSVSLNNTPPPVYITDVKLFGKPFDWVGIQKDKTLTLSYEMNELSFAFAVLNFSNPSGNKFYYQLVGLDKDWNRAAQGFANYTNLDPGTYQFKVKGSNGDGAMNEAGDFLTIVITPPFWRTSWFIVLCILITIALTYGWFRYRLRQALKLEHLRTRISSDLHDDIGSTLSSISILSNMVLKEEIHEGAREMVSEINDNSITLMDRMGDIVWSINPKNDSLQGLLLRVRQFSTALFEARGIDYEFEFPANVSDAKLTMENSQHLYMILKEAVNNLVKYSDCTMATIQVVYAAPALRVKITDNGKGFQKNSFYPGNGLTSMRNRAQLMNADLAIESNPGRGTEISLSLKIK